MNAESPTPVRVYNQAALRSVLVAKLTGLTRAQLQYWHEEGVQLAHIRPGKRGMPRLYSWKDYQRLSVISKLLALGIPLPNIRSAVRYMDENIPDWFVRALQRYDGSSPRFTGVGTRHVSVPNNDFVILADAAGQMSYRDAADLIDCTLGEIAAEGPLFRLSRFNDAVRMQPEINVGLPTLVGTRLETSFIARLVKHSSETQVARMYRLEEALVHRAVEFEEAA